MNRLKNITMKDIIFWAADSWNAMELLCHRKAWYPFLDIMNEENPT